MFSSFPDCQGNSFEVVQVLHAVLSCAVLYCTVLCCAVLCCAVLCCAVLCCAVLCCATSSSVCLHAPLCAHAAGDWQAHQDARLHCGRLLPNLRSTVPQGNGTGQPVLLALPCSFCSPASPLELLLLCSHHCSHTALSVRA